MRSSLSRASLTCPHPRQCLYLSHCATKCSACACMCTGGHADAQNRARVRRVASRVAGQRGGHGRIRGRPGAAGVAGGAPTPPPTLAGFSRGISSREHHSFSTVLSGVQCPATVPVGTHTHACQASLKPLRGSTRLWRARRLRRRTCLYWTDFFSSVAMSCVRAWCSPASRLACSWQASSTATSCCSRSSHSPRRVCSDEHNSCSLRSAVCVPASRACAIQTLCHWYACLARPWVAPAPVRSPARSAGLRLCMRSAAWMKQPVQICRTSRASKAPYKLHRAVSRVSSAIAADDSVSAHGRARQGRQAGAQRLRRGRAGG